MQAPPSLAGALYSVELDIGVEKGTWMPPTWGRSGARATPTVSLSFLEDGTLRVVDTAYWDRLTVQWEEEGGYEETGDETVRWWLAHNGIQRQDVELPPGRIYFSAGCWGSQLGRKGNLVIKQRKLGWLPFLPSINDASFLVGTFRTTRVEQEQEASESSAGSTDV